MDTLKSLRWKYKAPKAWMDFKCTWIRLHWPPWCLSVLWYDSSYIFHCKLPTSQVNISSHTKNPQPLYVKRDSKIIIIKKIIHLYMYMYVLYIFESNQVLSNKKSMHVRYLEQIWKLVLWAPFACQTAVNSPDRKWCSIYKCYHKPSRHWLHVTAAPKVDTSGPSKWH